MHLRSRVAMMLAFPFFANCSTTESTAITEACSVTTPNGNTPPGRLPDPRYYGNGSLWTVLSPGGKVVFQPPESGFPLPDGPLSIKLPWWRGVEGKLTIQGRRLDAPAPPLKAMIPEGYGNSGFQASGLIFPTTGCWEVTGRMGNTDLTFVILVVKIEKRN